MKPKAKQRGRPKVVALNFDLEDPKHRAYLSVRALQLTDKELDYLHMLISQESDRREKLRKDKKVGFQRSEKLTKAVWL